MDFIDGLPQLIGYEVIFVVVDQLSMYAHFVPLLIHTLQLKWLEHSWTTFFNYMAYLSLL